MASKVHKFAIGGGISAAVDLEKEDPISYTKVYSMKNSGETGRQYIQLCLNSWGRLMTLLPDVVSSVKAFKDALELHEDKKCDDLPANKTWPLSSNHAVFLSSREGTNGFKGRFFISLSLRGCFERNKKFFPKRGDGITFHPDDLHALMRASFDMYSSLRRECARHCHSKKEEPLCAGCKLVQSGPILCDNLAFKRSDLKLKGVNAVVDQLLESLCKFEQANFAGTWLISIGSKGHNVGGLDLKVSDQTRPEVFGNAAGNLTKNDSQNLSLKDSVELKSSKKGRSAIGGSGGGKVQLPDFSDSEESDDSTSSSLDIVSSSRAVTDDYRTRHPPASESKSTPWLRAKPLPNDNDGDKADNKGNGGRRSPIVFRKPWTSSASRKQRIVSDDDDDDKVDNKVDKGGSTSVNETTERETLKPKRKKSRFDGEAGQGSSRQRRSSEAVIVEEEEEEEEDAKKKWIDEQSKYPNIQISKYMNDSFVCDKGGGKKSSVKTAAARVGADVKKILDRYRGGKGGGGGGDGDPSSTGKVEENDGKSKLGRRESKKEASFVCRSQAKEEGEEGEEEEESQSFDQFYSQA